MKTQFGCYEDIRHLATSSLKTVCEQCASVLCCRNLSWFPDLDLIKNMKYTADMCMPKIIRIERGLLKILQK